MPRPEKKPLRNALTSRAWIGAAAFGLAATVSMVAAQAPQPPSGGRGQAPPGGRGAPGPARGGVMGAGPADAPLVDPALADRGRTIWAAECINCHGSQARGTDNGSNLTRSLVVLRDRYGSELGPFLKRGHKMQSGAAVTTITDVQFVDLAHFLRQRVNDSFRGSPLFKPQNVLTGDAKAGATFFNGEGKCATCHAATGNLAGIGGRFEPIDLQQRFLFPGGGRGRGRATGPPPASAVKVTVTPASAQPVTGVLVQMDDFNVSLRDASGAYRTFRRGPNVKVVKDDPLAAHHALLDTISDTNIHDVVAYLETLK